MKWTKKDTKVWKVRNPFQMTERILLLFRSFVRPLKEFQNTIILWKRPTNGRDCFALLTASLVLWFSVSRRVECVYIRLPSCKRREKENGMLHILFSRFQIKWFSQWRERSWKWRAQQSRVAKSDTQKRKKVFHSKNFPFVSPSSWWSARPLLDMSRVLCEKIVRVLGFQFRPRSSSCSLVQFVHMENSSFHFLHLKAASTREDEMRWNSHPLHFDPLKAEKLEAFFCVFSLRTNESAAAGCSRSSAKSRERGEERKSRRGNGRKANFPCHSRREKVRANRPKEEHNTGREQVTPSSVDSMSKSRRLFLQAARVFRMWEEEVEEENSVVKVVNIFFPDAKKGNWSGD